MKSVDVIVIGAGIMGAAAAWQIARSGARVLVIEAGSPAHDSGSSHGASRIFRRAYWEGSNYLPLLTLADQGWTELQDTSNKKMLFRTGGVFVGPAGGEVLAGSLGTAKAGQIGHAHWSAAEMHQHFPQFALPDQMHVLHEPGAYVIAAEQARLQMLELAVRHGAILWHGERVLQLSAGGAGAGVATTSGMQVSAQAVVVTAGPWMAKQLLPELAPWLVPCRIPVYWFAPHPGQEAAFQHERFPLFLYQFDDGALLYGIPAGMPGEAGVKIGFHNRQQLPADPDSPPPGPVPAAWLDDIGQRVSSIFPGLASAPCGSKWCWYTMSTDESFLLGQSERHSAVYFASACSGHGFKFAPAIGQALAAMAQGKPPPANIDAYSPRRLKQHEDSQSDNR